MRFNRWRMCTVGITAFLSACGPHPETVGAIVVLPDTVFMVVGDTVTLTAVTFDTAPGMSRAAVSWNTRTGSVVNVSNAGVAVARSVGTAFVTAAAEHVRDSAVITVVPDSQPVVRFGSMVQPILTVKCATAGCHVDPSSPLGLDLSESKSYDNVYKVVSQEEPVLLLVEPYRTDRSWLIRELEAHLHLDSLPPDAVRPDGVVHAGISLTRQDLSLIRRWIQSGAPNN